MASADEVDEFIDRVDEVTRLIDGLNSGTLPPDYIDRKIEAQQRDRDAAAARTAPKGPLPGPGSRGASDAAASRDAGGTAKAEEARQAELMRKASSNSRGGWSPAKQHSGA
jgi:hypothetical protein